MRVSLGIALALFGASPVFAQRETEIETGSHIPVPAKARISDDSHLADADRGRVVLAEFARCTVASNRAAVERVLRLPLDTKYEHSVTNLARSGCLGNGMMKFSTKLFRGALFTELYRSRDYAQKHGESWNASFEKISLEQNPLTHPSQEALQRLILMDFANCVIGRDGVNARASIMLPTASAPQEAALRALSPSFNACFPAGVSVTFSKPIIEGILAEVLYRGVDAPVQQTAGIK